MKPVSILAIAVILVFCFFEMAAADDDCGCGSSGLGDLSSYTDGVTDDDWGNSANSNDDAADTSMDSSSDSTSGMDSVGSNDSDSSSTSSESGSSYSNGGGSVEEAIVWRMKGDDLYERDMYNESLEAYEKAIGLDPYALKSWTGKGKALLALARPDGAADAFERAIRLEPVNAASYVQLGDALAAGGEYEKAVENYLKALAMNPNLAGVKEKISGAQEALVAVMETEEATAVSTMPPAVEETSVETNTILGEGGTGTVNVRGTPQAGVPGFPVLLLALITSGAVLVFRNK